MAGRRLCPQGLGRLDGRMEQNQPAIPAAKGKSDVTVAIRSSARTCDANLQMRPWRSLLPLALEIRGDAVEVADRRATCANGDTDDEQNERCCAHGIAATC